MILMTKPLYWMHAVPKFLLEPFWILWHDCWHSWVSMHSGSISYKNGSKTLVAIDVNLVIIRIKSNISTWINYSSMLIKSRQKIDSICHFWFSNVEFSTNYKFSVKQDFQKCRLSSSSKMCLGKCNSSPSFDPNQQLFTKLKFATTTLTNKFKPTGCLQMCVKETSFYLLPPSLLYLLTNFSFHLWESNVPMCMSQKWTFKIGIYTLRHFNVTAIPVTD